MSPADAAGPAAGADTTKLGASPTGCPATAGSSIVVRIDDAARKARHLASFRFAD
ncbi:hypothetical protein [Burkholderia cenocepacia]|uniref:hypothetical protein n=1 Tax=Burkholderia cenocepacia TaxID=95486 RepID=UPI0012BA94A2|nr:hypothetical protein [Burkholderia cenocepacia]MBR8075226.1 hypothetical protein [Burkholderia cenocepacia]